jgi:hypothetical protein
MSIRYPWPTYRRPLNLTLSDLQVDGVERDDLLDETHLRARLDESKLWRHLTVRASVTTDEPPLDVSEVRAHLLVSAPRTQTRVPVPLDSTEDGWSGVVTLHRDVLGGAVSVHAQIVGLVNDRRRLVGSSESWVLVVDSSEAPTPPGVPPFNIAWIDFSSEEAPQIARSSPEAHAVMDIASEPVLLLNSNLDGFQSLLHADHAKAERRRLRDLLGSGVARYAVATLFRAAASEIVAAVVDDEDPEPPAERLRRQVCEAIAEAMTGLTSAEELYRRLVDAERGSMTDRAMFWTEIDLAIDKLTGVSNTVAEVCKEVQYA